MAERAMFEFRPTYTPSCSLLGAPIETAVTSPEECARRQLTPLRKSFASSSTRELSFRNTNCRNGVFCRSATVPVLTGTAFFPARLFMRKRQQVVSVTVKR
ncbi:hypothetical protein MTO96_010988 [Rhipicephalus appendiculatus]